jgi:dephospho-CoA kinase
MLKVGVTGGIGSGKSLVCSIISAMGFPVYNADLEARTIVNTDPVVIGAIINLFGEGVYENGQLDRKKVGALVFSNPALLNQLNMIVHPAVARHFDQWVEQHEHRALVVKETAILFESGAYRGVDRIVAVTAPLDLRIRRVVERDSISPEEVMKRIGNQLPEEVIRARSHYVIDNDDVKLLLPQVVVVLEGLLNRKE